MRISAARTCLVSALVLGPAAMLPAACNDQQTIGPEGKAVATNVAPAATVVPPPPILIEPLTGRHQFTDNLAIQIRNKPQGRPTEVLNLADPSNIAVLKITVQPGARFPWHTHPGPVLVAVHQGKLVYVYADDCVRRHYPQTAFVDPGFGNVHTAFNPSTTQEAILIATFLGAPASGPLTIPVAAEQQAALDAKCDMSAPMAHAH